MSSDNQVILFGDSKPGHARPAGIYVLASFLRQNNVKVQAVWGFSYISYDNFRKICLKFLNENVKVVGISTTLLADRPKHNFYGCSLENLKPRLELIKQLAPNAKIVVGGSQVMYDPLPQGSGTELIDYYIKGQGEQVMLDLVMSDKPLKTESILPPIISDKMYPYNDFATTSNMFHPSDCILPGEGLPLEFARGCIFKCSFCSYALTGKKAGDYTKAKATLIKELIHNYQTFGTTHYYCTDDTLNDSEEKVDMILEVSRALPFKLQYTAFMRLDLIRRFPNMAPKLKESGMIGCFFGIETINDDSGRKVGKGLGLERINEAIKICNDAWKGEVFGQGSFILGLPGHDENTKFELIRWLERPSVRKLIKFITVYPLYIAPGLGLSDIDQNPGKFGYIEDVLTPPDLAVQRYDHTSLNWRNGDYTFSQAFKDAEFVKGRFWGSKFYPGIGYGGIFRLITLLSLSDKKEEMIKLLLKDVSYTWETVESWQKYLEEIQSTHRDRYLELLLSS